MRCTYVLAFGFVLGWAILFPRASSGQTPARNISARFIRGDFAEVLSAPTYRPAEVEIVEPKGEFAKIDVARSNAAIRELRAAKTEKAKRELIKKIVDDADAHTPPTLYVVAQELFQLGDRDEAIFWIVLANLRASSDVLKCGDPSAQSAVQALTEICGQGLTAYIARDWNKLDAAFDKAVDWDRTHARRYDRKWVALHGMSAFTKQRVEFAPARDWDGIDTEHREKEDGGFHMVLATVRRFDRNGDGRVDEAEEAELRRVLEREAADGALARMAPETDTPVKGDFSLTILQAKGLKKDAKIVEPKGEFARIDVSRSDEALRRLLTAPTQEKAERIKEILAEAETFTPPVLHLIAAELFRLGDREEAMFWFSVGQTRASSDIRKSLDPTAAQAMPFLVALCQPHVERFTFEDLAKLDVVFERAAKWDREHSRKYDRRWIALFGEAAARGGTIAFLPEERWAMIDESANREECESYPQYVARIRSFDKNGDGKLDAQEIDEYARASRDVPREDSLNPKPKFVAQFVRGDFSEVLFASRLSPDEVVILEPKGEFAKIDVKKSNDAMRRLRAAKEKSEKRELLKPILAEADAYTPPVLHVVAAELFALGDRDEAAFWFYLAQLRVASDILKSRDPSTEGALDALDEVCGADVKRHALQNWRKLDQIYDRVLDWDRDHPRRYDSRWIALHGLAAWRSERIEFEPEKDWKSIDERQRTTESEEFHRFLELVKKCDQNGDGKLDATEAAEFQRQVRKSMEESEGK